MGIGIHENMRSAKREHNNTWFGVISREECRGQRESVKINTKVSCAGGGTAEGDLRLMWLGTSHMLMLGAYWSRKVSITTQQVRKNNMPHFEENQRTQQGLWKYGEKVDKPGLVRVTVLGCIVRVSNPFL
jgi:hypothetical protein